MAITLAQIERATRIIEKRIQKHISEIKREHQGEIEEIEGKARDVAYFDLGILEQKQRIAKRDSKIEELNKQIHAVNKENEADEISIFEKLFPNSTENPYHYHVKQKVEEKIKNAIKSARYRAFSQSENLSRIAVLEDEYERAEEALIVATSPKQLRAVMDAVNNLLGENRGELGETAFNTEAPEE